MLLLRICVDTGRGCSLLLTSPLAASQNFEYKMSNILDKPLEVCLTITIESTNEDNEILLSLCLATYPCSQVLSLLIVTPLCKTGRTGKGH